MLTLQDFVLIYIYLIKIIALIYQNYARVQIDFYIEQRLKRNKCALVIYYDSAQFLIFALSPNKIMCAHAID